jgi:hypothetical protein
MDKAKYWHQIELPKSEKVTIIEDVTSNNANHRDYIKELEWILSEKYPDWSFMQALDEAMWRDSFLFLKFYVFSVTLLDIDYINNNIVENKYCHIRFESHNLNDCSCFIEMQDSICSSMVFTLRKSPPKDTVIALSITGGDGNHAIIENILDTNNIHKDTIILQSLYKFFTHNPHANINYLNQNYLKHICPELGRIKQPPRQIKRI